MYTVVIKKKAKKEIECLPEYDQERVYRALLELGETPFAGKRLDGEYQGVWSLRVWPYRILYTIHRQTVTVVVLRVQHRKDVYR